MITPEAIQKKDFTRGVRGYKEEEVDQFLDVIAADIDMLYRENAALKEHVKALSLDAERYRNSENAVFGTLEAAKALMVDISASAEKRADILMKNAELDADRIRRDARESVERITEEAVALSRRWELFSARFRNLLETELDRFDSFTAGLLLDDDVYSKKGGVRGFDGARKSAADPMSVINPDKTFKSPKQL
jgi:cell division initiation protein